LNDYPVTVFAMGHCHNEEIKAIGDLDTVAIVMKFSTNTLATIDYSRNSCYGYDQRCEVAY
jgi:myo-inositol 2-dehydrogenase/D-chiro-inositol 1-dehydrogenase